MRAGRIAARVASRGCLGHREPQVQGPRRLPAATGHLAETPPELSLDLPETFDAFWTATEPRLTEQLREVADLLARGELSSVSVQRGRLRIGKVTRAVPDEVEPLGRRLSARLPRVKITDLLLEVNAWTHFTGAFLNLHSGKEVERHDHLLTAILADGLNLGLTKMAEASRTPV